MRVRGWVGTCAGGVRFSNSNRIIPSDYRILLLLKMPIPNRYYKEKVIYKDIFSVPIIKNAYKSYRVSFLGGKVEMHSLV